MKFKNLGTTGVKVSELCFGTMSFGGDADEATSSMLYKRCRDAGVNFFDCANVYSGGKAEEILGRLIHSHREELIITSKVTFPMSADPNARGASRRHIIASIDASLKRLKTDHLDIYFIHRFDDEVRQEDTLQALDDLVRQGKILYPGVSNHAAWQIMKANGICERHGWARYEVLQPMYNLVKRQAEVEILPMAEAEHLAVIPYSPLGGGLLTGKYGVGHQPMSGRLVENHRYIARYGESWSRSVAENFTRLATELGYHPASLAIAWVASHPAVTAPILGARSIEQLDPALDAVNIPMTPELRDKISALSPEPPLATDRLEEKTL